MAGYNYYKKSKEELEKERREAIQMKSLIITALDKWEIVDIMEVISENIGKSKKSTDECLIYTMRELLAQSGYSVIKTDNLQDEYALKDLVAKSLYNYTDMNRNCLFPS